MRKLPVLVLDVMDTLVKDPFFNEIPAFFDMSFKELLAAKHPTAWVEFELGEISESQLFDKFFLDGRRFDGPGLLQSMVNTYQYLDGVEDLLTQLNVAGYELHAMSNYPMWYRCIEDKLELSQHLQWSFISCDGPMKGLRKPSPAAYQVVLDTLQVPASSVIFVDDRQVNVEAAAAAGLDAIRFEGAAQLRQALQARGVLLP